MPRRHADPTGYVAAFMNALGPSSRAPAANCADRPVPAVPDWRSAGSQPARLPAAAVELFGLSEGERSDIEALAARFDRYGPE